MPLWVMREGRRVEGLPGKGYCEGDSLSNAAGSAARYSLSSVQ
jgi:hypothetical protein